MILRKPRRRPREDAHSSLLRSTRSLCLSSDVKQEESSWTGGTNVIRVLLNREIGETAAQSTLLRTAAALIGPTLEAAISNGSYEKDVDGKEGKEEEEAGRTATAIDNLPTACSYSPSVWNLQSPVASNDLYHNALNVLLAGPRGKTYIYNASSSSPLLTACRGGNIVALRCLLNAGAISTFELGSGKISALNMLMSDTWRLERFGLYDNTNYKDDRTPVLLVDVIRVLLDAGVDPSLVDDLHGTPLHVAARKGYIAAAEVLLSQPETNLNHTFLKFHTKQENQTLNTKVDVNALDPNGRTPIFTTLNTEVARFLMSCGAHINTKDNKDNTPLHAAVLKNRIDVVKELICAGADVHALGESGNNTLHCAAQNDGEELVRFLVDLGVLINGRNICGQTPLHVATEHFYRTTIAALISLGADVNAADKDGCTPLHYVTKIGSRRITPDSPVREIRHWCGTYFETETELTEELRPTIAELLLSSGARVNAQNNDIETPLHKAASNNSLSTVKVLLAAGADVKSKDINGKTAADIVSEKLSFLKSNYRFADTKDHMSFLEHLTGAEK